MSEEPLSPLLFELLELRGYCPLDDWGKKRISSELRSKSNQLNPEPGLIYNYPLLSCKVKPSENQYNGLSKEELKEKKSLREHELRLKWIYKSMSRLTLSFKSTSTKDDYFPLLSFDQNHFQYQELSLLKRKRDNSIVAEDNVTKKLLLKRSDQSSLLDLDNIYDQQFSNTDQLLKLQKENEQLKNKIKELEEELAKSNAKLTELNELLTKKVELKNPFEKHSVFVLSSPSPSLMPAWLFFKSKK